MRQATRIPTHRPNRLPTPVVRSNVVSQRVDMRPAGNTIAVTALADNPFEGNQRAVVVTQASGGTAPCPASMASKRVASSGFMPGIGRMGEEEAKEEDKKNWFETLFTGAKDVYGNFTAAEIAEQQRRTAEADARAAEAKAAADMERSRTDRLLSATRKGILDTSINIAGMQVNVLMLAAGGGLLWYAMSKRGKSSGKASGKSRRR